MLPSKEDAFFACIYGPEIDGFEVPQKLKSFFMILDTLVKKG